MRRLLVLAGVIVVATLAPSAAAAGDLVLDEPEISLDDHPDVVLTVAAPVGLRSSARPVVAHVTESGEPRPATVRHDVEPLDVALVLDTSGSMAGAPMDAARAAAVGFVARMPAHAEIAIVGFGAAPYVAAPFSADRAATNQAIADLKASGETALYDAVDAAAALFSRADRRRAFVVLSDGGDTASTAPLQAAVDAARRSAADVYVVELVTPESNREALRAIAEATGGEMVSATDAAALTGAYDAIATDLVGRYRVTYRSGSGGASRVELVLDDGATRATWSGVVDLPMATRDAARAPVVNQDGGWVPSTVGLLEADAGLLLGLAAMFVALVMLAVALLGTPARSSTLDRRRLGANDRPSRLAGLSERTTAAAERVLQRRSLAAGIDATLDRAGVALRPAELVVLVATGVISAAAVGLLLGGPALALLFGLTVAAAPRFVLSFLATRRQGRFADQLSDSLQLLAGSLRAGYGLLQAIDNLASAAERPTADEFRRLGTEVRLGRSLDEALDAMAVRVASDDFEWVAQAIMINREVGGDLSEVLDRVGETIRERGRIRRQVKALSAEGRISAIVLFVLPFFLVGFMSLTNPAYLGQLFSTGLGVGMVVGALLLLGVGGLWLRKIVRVVF